MEITLEMVDQVRERTGCTYEAAKIALEGANGSVVDAIVAIEKSNGEGADVNKKLNELVEKIKAAVQMGNVNRIRILRGEEELANIPVNAGIAGGVLGLLAGPAVLISAAIAGVVAKFGFNCRFEIVKADGTVEEILGEEAEEEQNNQEEQTNQEEQANQEEQNSQSAE